MLKSVRVKRILAAVVSVVLVAAMVVAGVLFSDTDKSKSGTFENFEFVKLAASANASASDGVFSVEVTQNAVNKIVVTGTVDTAAYSGTIALRVGTNVLFSQIFTVSPDVNGEFNAEYLINPTFAKEYSNELPVFICYNGTTELLVGTVGVVTYDSDNGILGYPEGSYYISGGQQVELTTPYAPDDARAAGEITVVYGTNMLTFAVNPAAVAPSPEKGDNGVYNQYGVDGTPYSITACLNTTEGREYAVVLVGGSIGLDYGIADNAWIAAADATEIAGLTPGAKYSVWVRVAGENGTLPSAPVYLGEFVAMDADDAAAKAEFLAKYDEVTVTNGHKLYDSADPTVTATPTEVLQLITLYNKIPAEYKVDEIAEKGEYLLISNYLANHQGIVNAAKTAEKYDDLRANYSYADMMAAFNDFVDIVDELGNTYLGNEADAEYVIDLAYTAAKIYVLSPIDVNDAAKDEKYEVVHYFYANSDDESATVDERYADAEMLVLSATMFRDEYELGLFVKEYELGLFVKEYDLFAFEAVSEFDIATLEAMFTDIKDVEVFDTAGFGKDFVEELSVEIYLELVDKYGALIEAIDVKNDTLAAELKEYGLGMFDELAEYVELNGNVFNMPEVKELYTLIVDTIDARFMQLDAIDTVKALKNGSVKIDGIVDGYVDILENVDVTYDLDVAIATITETVDMAEKEVAYELAMEKAAKDVAAMKDGSANVDAVAEKYLAELDNVIYDYTIADDVMAEIAAIVDGAKNETDFEKAVNTAKADLAADVAAKKESGKYNKNGKAQLDAKLAAAIVNLNNLDYAAGKRIADVDAAVATALNDFASVDVVIIVVGNGAEYADENPAEFNVKVLNDNGMSSALTVSIKLAEGKDEIANGKVTVATGEFTDELAAAAVDGKKVLFGFNITATNAKADNGYYTVKIMLPKSYRAESGLQVVSESGETVYVYESAKGGAYLVFKTASLDGTYYVTADKEVSLTWLIVLLAVLVVIEIAVVVYFIIRKKKFVAVFVPFLALLFPTGVIPAVIALGAVATVGAVGSSIFAVKTVKDEKKAKAEKAAEPVVEEKAEDVVEAPVEEVVEEAPVEEVVEEAPIEEAVEEAPVEEAVEEAPVEEAIEEAPVEEAVEEAPVEEVVEEAPATEIDDVEEIVVVDENGEETSVSYDYSFRSKLMLAATDGQSRYALISNTLLSYGIKSTESWSKERYFLKGKTYANLTFRGKTLCVYLAIAPETLEGTKYFFENVGGVKKYADIPVMVRVRSSRGCKYVLELIKMMCEDAGLVQKKSASDEFKYKSATTEEIIEMGYIKVVKGVRKAAFNPDSVKKKLK